MPSLDAATLLMVIAVVDAFACAVWLILGAALKIAPRAAWRIAAYHGLLALVWWPATAQSLEAPLTLPVSLIAAGLLTAGVRALMRFRFALRDIHDVLVIVIGGLLLLAVVYPDLQAARIVVNLGAALLALIAANDIRVGAGFRIGFTSLLTLPYLILTAGALWRAGGMLGWLPDGPAHLGMAESALLAMVRLFITLSITTGLVALVLQRLIARVRHLTRRDALTGLLNRRAMEDHLMRMQALVERGHPHAVLVLDVDHFKRINDELGHAGGDAALQHLAGVLGAALRDADCLGRLGGEEFAALLPDTDLNGAAQVAERLRRLLQDHPLTWGDKVWPISASFGVATLRRGDSHGRDALARADAAMYAAKARGRNRVLRSADEMEYA